MSDIEDKDGPSVNKLSKIHDIDKTLISNIPIDFVKDTNESKIIEYREFQTDNKVLIDKNNELKDKIHEKQKEIIVSDVGNDENGGVVYDIIHILDNVYSYGRTVIENNCFNFANNDDFNLVYPNIYIGNYSTTTNLELLRTIGITDIISVIPTFNPPFPEHFKYLHIPAYDDQTQDLSQYFDYCNFFIKNILEKGGKIFIHCMVGRSRSVTIFLAFLIDIILGNFNQSINLQLNNNINNEEKNEPIILTTNVKENMSMIDNNPGYITIKYITPKLSNQKNNILMIYKQETMFLEVEDLIEKYKLLQKEIHIFSDNKDTDKTKEQLKQQYAKDFIIQILKYIKKYRPDASPNPYFINQLTNLIIF